MATSSFDPALRALAQSLLPPRELTPGTRVGPYEILGTVGRGGMGVVYRAGDARLGREVALKLLPPAASGDADRVRRFELEARATAMLSHPNILQVYDVGAHEGSPYIVSELLAGETLRARLRQGPLGPRKAIAYGLQIAQGLAAAHEKGIVHRDLKPENLFVTTDDRLKILDFGLAKLTEPAGAPGGAPLLTEPGLLLGTPGYMAPEQVRGEPAEAASDLFALGAVLYELVSGRQAFTGDTKIQVLNAILTSEPPELPCGGAQLSTIVRHCLEKKPAHRFQSARDLAFQLETLPISSSGGVSVLPDRRALRKLLRVAAAAAALGLAALGGARLASPPAVPVWRRLTFASGSMISARFGPDGGTIFYSGAFGAHPIQTFSLRLSDAAAVPLSTPAASVLSISPRGELLLLLDPVRAPRNPLYAVEGRLARAPPAGGAPRELVGAVEAADWALDGAVALVREVDGRARLELPAGHVLFETAGWLSYPRVSPDGKRIAVIVHPLQADNRGFVAWLDSGGGPLHALPGSWHRVDGLGWSPRGDELWFAAAEEGLGRALRAQSLDGRLRTLAEAPGLYDLFDVSRDGRGLVEHGEVRSHLRFHAPGRPEVDLSHLDFSLARGLSADARRVLLVDDAGGGGNHGRALLRGTDGSPPIFLGHGYAEGLSPDGAVAALWSGSEPATLSLLPTGAGQPRSLKLPIARLGGGLSFTPDGRSAVLTVEAKAGEPVRVAQVDLDSGALRLLTPPGYAIEGHQAVSPDGARALVRGLDGRFFSWPLAGGAPAEVRGLLPGEAAVRWTADGAAVFAVQRLRLPAPIRRVDPLTGSGEAWGEIAPANTAGFARLTETELSDDGRSFVYGYTTVLTELYLVEGLR